MKWKSIVSALIILFPCLATATLTIHYLDSENELIELALIRTLVFSNDEIPRVKIINRDATTQTKSNVATIVFSKNDVLTSLTSKDTPQVYIFPNPTTDMLTIENVSTSVASLYDSLGGLVWSQMLNEGRNIVSLRGLNNGVYMLLINNTMYKVVKK